MPSGPFGTAIACSRAGVPDARSIGGTSSPLATYATSPSGATAIAWGALVSCRSVTAREAVLITLTDCPSESETHTHLPLGLTAILQGPAPTLIGRPGVAGLVVRSRGVTVLELKLLTY